MGFSPIDPYDPGDLVFDRIIRMIAIGEFLRLVIVDICDVRFIDTAG